VPACLAFVAVACYKKSVKVIAFRLVVLAMLLVAMPRSEAQEHPPSVLGGAPLLHAHNAYPEKGQWRDRIDRALATGLSPIVIEQDIALDGAGRSVVSHDADATGAEPTLEQHFFDRVRPMMERALAEGRRERWPLVILHLDFKSNEPAHHRAVLDVLRRHRSWLTTAPSAPGASAPSPFAPGPLIVLTENGAVRKPTSPNRSPRARRCSFLARFPAPSFPPPTIRKNGSDCSAQRRPQIWCLPARPAIDAG